MPCPPVSNLCCEAPSAEYLELLDTFSMGFLDLPHEIKNAIYRLVLGDRTIHIHMDDNDKCYHITCQSGLTAPRMQQSLNNTESKAKVAGDEGFLHAECCAKKTRLLERVLVDGITMSEARASLDAKDCTSQVQLALLFVCRQASQEASSVVYSTNEFSFDDPEVACCFMQASSLGPLRYNPQICRVNFIIRKLHADCGPWSVLFADMPKIFDHLHHVSLEVYYIRWCITSQARLYFPYTQLANMQLERIAQLPHIRSISATVLEEDRSSMLQCLSSKYQYRQVWKGQFYGQQMDGKLCSDTLGRLLFTKEEWAAYSASVISPSVTMDLRSRIKVAKPQGRWSS